MGHFPVSHGDKTMRDPKFAEAVAFFNAVSSGSASIDVLPPDYLGQAEAELDWIFQKCGMHLVFGGTQPCYVPLYDTVYMPLRRSFANPMRFYEVLSHEGGHWTGARHRLRRDLSGRFGTASYRFEEFVAQWCSITLFDHVGLPTSTGIQYSYFVGYAASSGEAEAMLEHAMRAGEAAAQYILDCAARGGR